MDRFYSNMRTLNFENYQLEAALLILGQGFEFVQFLIFLDKEKNAKL